MTTPKPKPKPKSKPKRKAGGDLARLLAPRKGGQAVAEYTPAATDPDRLGQQAQALRFARLLVRPAP